MTKFLNKLIPSYTEVYIEQPAWCQLDTADYCPLVISLMSVIIILSLILIVYLCARTSFCRCRSLFKRSSISTDQLTRSSLNIASVSHQVEIRPAQFNKTHRPPPSYEESQMGKTRFSRVIRTYPRSKPRQVQVNSAFSMENERASVVFPEYRCLSLITSPSTGNLAPRVVNTESSEIIMVDQLFQNDEVPPPYEQVISRSTDPDVVYF